MNLRLSGRSRVVSALLLALAGFLAPSPAAASLPGLSGIRADELRDPPSLPQTLIPEPASAPSPFDIQPRTRVRGFELGLHCFIGGEAGLTCRSRPAYALPHHDLASERSVFTGYLFDKETNLLFAKARFYDPEVGRFTTQDSFLGHIDEPPSLHRFAYGRLNPLRYVDPTGHQTVPANVEVDEKDLILRDVREADRAYVNANPQLAGPASEEARQTTQPRVVDEDYGGLLGNIIEGGAKWAANTWVGQKVRGGLAHARDSLEALATKLGPAASGLARGGGVRQDPTVLGSKQGAATALQGEYTEPIVRRNVGVGFEEAKADLAREGAERATREGVPMVAAAIGGRGLKALDELAAEVGPVARRARSGASTSSTFSVGKTHLNQAELKELEGFHFTNTTGAGAARPPRHHIFVQQQREWFAQRGVDIDRYTLELDWGTHSAIHTMGWNERVAEFMAREERLGRQYTKREILNFGAELRRGYGLQADKVVPFQDAK